MTLTEEKKDGVLIPGVAGRLDVTTSDELERCLQALIAEGATRLVLDLEKVDYVSSAGLRVLLATLQRLENVNGSLGLPRTQEYVREIVEVAGLDTVFDLYESVEEAVKGTAG